MRKVKITNAEVIGLAECLNEICTAGTNLKPRTWFTLTAIRKSLIEQGKLIDEANKQIAEKYKVKDESGDEIIPQEKVSQFQKDRQEILTMEVSFEMLTLDLSSIEKEMPSMKGIKNLYLLFDYVIIDDAAEKKLKKA